MQAKHLPIDILNKTFPRRVRGFDRSVVSSFLEEVASSMEEVIAQNSSLGQRLQAAEEELARYKAMENTLNEALILAQKTAQELHLNAQKQADLLLAQANQEREQLFRSAKEEITSLQNQIDELSRTRQRFLAELRGLLTSVWTLAQDSRVPPRALPLFLEPSPQSDEKQGLPLLSRQ